MPTTRKILLVEDDELLLSAYAQMEIVAGKGTEIFIAENGREAIEVIDKEHPDIILLDLIMPEIDGFGVLEHLNATGAIQKTKVYVFTNLSDEKDRKRAMDLGATDYIIKSNVLISSIKQLVVEGKGDFLKHLVEEEEE